jgi:hypothetical protein
MKYSRNETLMTILQDSCLVSRHTQSSYNKHLLQVCGSFPIPHWLSTVGLTCSTLLTPSSPNSYWVILKYASLGTGQILEVSSTFSCGRKVSL